MSPSNRLQQRRQPAVRARQLLLKRQSPQLDPDEPGFSLTGPVTLTLPKTNLAAGTLPPLTVLPDSTAIPTATPTATPPSGPIQPSLTPLNTATPIPAITKSTYSTPSTTPTVAQTPTNTPSQPTTSPSTNTNTDTSASSTPSNGSSQNDTTSNAGARRHSGLSGGGVAAIVIVILLLVTGLAFFLVRRRSVAKRQKKTYRNWGAPVLGGANTNSNTNTASNDISQTERGLSSPSMAQTGGAGGGNNHTQPPLNTYTLPRPPAAYNPSLPAVSIVPSSPPPGSTSGEQTDKVATVQCTFIPTLPDELSITTGETVRVLAEYDDGWGLCANGQGDRGMVPLECLGLGRQIDRGSKRASSLAGALKLSHCVPFSAPVLFVRVLPTENEPGVSSFSIPRANVDPSVLDKKGLENLIARISRLTELDPLAVSITWGAGGHTKSRSLELAGVTQNECGVDTVLHLTCTNMESGMVDAALGEAKRLGIDNILALRGDPPRGEEHWIPVDPRFTHGIDLVRYIRSSPRFANEFCIGVAAYPDGYGDLDEDSEIRYLKEKVDAGADFIVTQLFYDADGFLRWLSKVRERGITVPIIPGIMPIQSYASFLRLTKLCGTRVPAAVSTALEPIRHDDQKVKDYGVSLAVEMIKKLTADTGIRGVHFCTLNLEKSVQRILENLQWTGHAPDAHNRLIVNQEVAQSSPTEAEFMVTPLTATRGAAAELANGIVVDGEGGRGELNKVTTWDEFPNGRFGDFKSPAFGDQDQWGGSGLSRSSALSQWGHPRTTADLTHIFLQHLRSEIATMPFSPTPLSEESLMIISHLEKLTEQEWWTVGSQPAVDGASSMNDVLGWGPPGGYVFQKSFVEFFAKQEDVDRIERKIAAEGQGWIHYFAGNNMGEFRGNVPEGGRNAVTWGIFPGQEVAQSTIIERESFLAWKDDAFSVWAEWASFYRPGSEERMLLEQVRDERWLVSIVHHDYKNQEALWTFLSDV